MAGGPLVSEDTKKLLTDKAIGYKQTIADDKTSAIAWQFEPTKGWPAIVYLSPHGVVVSKTFKFVKDDEIAKHVDDAADKGKALDEELAKLEAAVAKDQDDVAALDALCGFWTSHGNWGEALPLLEKLKKMSEGKKLRRDKRYTRWLELARARAISHSYEGAIDEAHALAAAAEKDEKKDGVSMQAAQAARILTGFCREQQGDVKAAREEYEKAVALDKENKFGKQAQAAIDRLKRTGGAEDEDK